MKKILFPICLLTITLIIGAIIFFTFNNMHDKEKIAIHGVYLRHGKNVTPFVLRNTQNQRFTDSNFLNQWSLVFLGYTRCPDICPTAMHNLSDFLRKIQSQPNINIKNIPQIVFISVDSVRDNKQDLQNFINRFNQNIVGLYGDNNEIKNIARNFGVAFTRVYVGKTKQNYVIDHSASIFVVNPLGQIKAILSPPHTGNNLLKDYLQLIKQS